MGTCPSLRAASLRSSLSTRMTSWPRSAKQAPATNPTYPEPTTAIRMVRLQGLKIQVVVQFEKEASQTRDYCVAKDATLRAARPDPSLRKKRLFRMTTKLHHHQKSRNGRGGGPFRRKG